MTSIAHVHHEMPHPFLLGNACFYVRATLDAATCFQEAKRIRHDRKSKSPTTQERGAQKRADCGSFSKTRSNFDMIEGLIIVPVCKRLLVPAGGVWLSYRCTVKHPLSSSPRLCLVIATNAAQLHGQAVTTMSYHHQSVI